jgi:hypothetical protein
VSQCLGDRKWLSLKNNNKKDFMTLNPNIYHGGKDTKFPLPSEFDGEKPGGIPWSPCSGYPDIICIYLYNQVISFNF